MSERPTSCARRIPMGLLKFPAVVILVLILCLGPESAAAGSSSKKTTSDAAASGSTSGDGPSAKLLNSEIWQLQDQLYNGYNPTVRPVDHPSKPVNVTIDLIVFNLIALDEKDQTFQTNCELVLIWKDYFLTWDPKNYSGIQSTRLDPNKIWIPDVLLYNSASTDYKAATISTYAMVQSDGTVRYLINGLFTSVCSNLNVDYFPFDQQECFLKFAPWTQDVSAVRLTPLVKYGSLASYSPLGKFKLLSVESQLETGPDPCCPNTTFDNVWYYIHIHRRPMFYIINYIFPSVLINAIGCMVFYVPCDSGEKVTLGISAMLTMVVFLMTMTNAMPPATATPLLSVYYCACVVLVTLEVLFSIMVLNVFHRGQYGKRASDFTIGVAYVMSRMTFTTMKDPTGHFADRRSEMSDKIRKTLGMRPKSSFPGNAGPASVTAANAPADAMNGSRSSLEDKIDEEEFWRPGVKFPKSALNAPALPGYRAPDGQPMQGQPSGKTSNADLAAKFGIVGYNRGSTVDDSVVNTKQPENPFHRMEALMNRIAKTAEKAVGMIKVTQLRYHEEDYKDSLELEFMELARIYDRFFLWLSVLATLATSLGILMSSPYSAVTPGV